MSGGEIREMIDEEVNNDPEMSAEAENFDQDGIERKIFCDGNVYKQMEEGEEWILDQDEHYETIVEKEDREDPANYQHYITSDDPDRHYTRTERRRHRYGVEVLRPPPPGAVFASIPGAYHSPRGASALVAQQNDNAEKLAPNHFAAGTMPVMWNFPRLVVQSTTTEEDAKLRAPVA